MQAQCKTVIIVVIITIVFLIAFYSCQKSKRIEYKDTLETSSNM